MQGIPMNSTDIALQKTTDNQWHLIIKQNANEILYPFVHVPAGSYMRSDGAAVQLSAFYMAKFAVTQLLYAAVMGEIPSRFKGNNHPVEQVTWYDAIEFCDQLNKLAGITDSCYHIDKNIKDPNNKNESDKIKWKVDFYPEKPGFRLPTEAQWEYAARGGEAVSEAEPGRAVAERSRSYAGSELIDAVAWYESNNDTETRPVGQRFPNALGLNDLSGNVWEWCWDWRGDYDKAGLKNPVGAAQGSYRVYRGGSYFDYADYAAVGYRNLSYPFLSLNFLGFRLLFVPQF